MLGHFVIYVVFSIASLTRCIALKEGQFHKKKTKISHVEDKISKLACVGQLLKIIGWFRSIFLIFLC